MSRSCVLRLVGGCVELSRASPGLVHHLHHSAKHVHGSEDLEGNMQRRGLEFVPASDEVDLGLLRAGRAICHSDSKYKLFNTGG